MHEATAEQAPARPERAPEVFKAVPQEEASSDERINAVRERLGLSRREVLAAGIAVAVAKPEVSRAEQERYRESGLSEEAQAHYEACLGELRESARSDTHELTRLFVARTDGTYSWIKPATETTSGNSAGDSAVTLVHMPDTAFIAVRDRAIQEGSIVIDQHTHPTRALDGIPQDGNEALRGKVPPSPIDILSSVWMGSRIQDNETLARYRREAVTEQGVWRYGPVSKEAAVSISTALDAGDRLLLALDTRHRVEGRAFGQYISGLIDQGVFPENMRPLTVFLGEGRLGSMLAEDPQMVEGLSRFTFLYEQGALPRPPREARAYLREIERANRQIQTALSGISGRAEEYALDMPYLTEESVASYQERWRRLGVELSFRPFNTETR